MVLFSFAYMFFLYILSVFLKLRILTCLPLLQYIMIRRYQKRILDSNAAQALLADAKTPTILDIPVQTGSHFNRH